jgi:hypothetical protein
MGSQSSVCLERQLNSAKKEVSNLKQSIALLEIKIQYLIDKLRYRTCHKCQKKIQRDVSDDSFDEREF